MRNNFKMSFETYYNKFNTLKEADDMSPDMSPDMELSPNMEMPSSSSSLANKVVTSGYAYYVNLILKLLKFNIKNIPKQYYKLSDNEIINAKMAYKYINVLKNMLSETTVDDMDNQDLGEIEGIEDQAIDVDDNTMQDMANIAIKSLFYPSKNQPEFISNLNDIENILAQSENKVNVKNANAVYQIISNLVSME